MCRRGTEVLKDETAIVKLKPVVGVGKKGGLFDHGDER